jgi:hypothetical protein
MSDQQFGTDQSIQYSLHFYSIIVTVCTILWSILYRYLCQRQPNRSDEWHCRVVTVIHASVCVAISFAILMTEGKSPFLHENQILDSTHGMLILFCISVSYFIFDLYWCCSHSSEGLVMYIHHICAILGYGIGIVKAKYGLAMIAAVFGTEFTNPLLQLRWFLRTNRQEVQNQHMDSSSNVVSPPRYERKGLEIIVDFLFMILFGILRVGIGTPLCISFFTNCKVDTSAKVGGGSLYFIGIAFWIQICVYAWTKYGAFLFRRKGTTRANKTHQTSQISSYNDENQNENSIDSGECIKQRMNCSINK